MKCQQIGFFPNLADFDPKFENELIRGMNSPARMNGLFVFVFYLLLFSTSALQAEGLPPGCFAIDRHRHFEQCLSSFVFFFPLFLPEKFQASSYSKCTCLVDVSRRIFFNPSSLRVQREIIAPRDLFHVSRKTSQAKEHEITRRKKNKE